MNRLALFAGLLKGLFVAGPVRLIRAERYLAAWNAHDAAAVVAMTGDGGYSDPLSKQTLHGEALRAHLQMLFDAFPDLTLALTSPVAVAAGGVVAGYRLTGTNRGDLPGDFGIDAVPATGRSVALDGVITLTFERGGVTVRNHFDLEHLATALDFIHVLMPRRIRDHQFGVYYRMNTGNTRPPEAVGMTWIEVTKPEEFIPVAALTHQVAEAFAANPGFVTGIVGAFPPDAEGRSGGFTLSAWETLDALDQHLLSHPRHQQAVNSFMREGMAHATHSRVYSLVRAKPVMVACPGCAKKNNGHKSPAVCSACGTALPPPPAYW